MQDKPDLAALIGSRICHDLISPIGAIGNGLELLIMESNGATPSPELTLISESVAAASARVRFFRLAFGQDALDQRIARVEVVSILRDMYPAGARLAVDWSSGNDLSRREAKLTFLLLLCVEFAMAYGGKLCVEQTATGWRIEGDAKRLKIEPALWEMLASLQIWPATTAAQVQFALASEALTLSQQRLVTTLSETRITLQW